MCSACQIVQCEISINVKSLSVKLNNVISAGKSCISWLEALLNVETLLNVPVKNLSVMLRSFLD